MYTSTVTHKILVLRYISSCFIMFATSFLRLGSPSVTGPSSKRLGKNSGNLSLGTGLRGQTALLWARFQWPKIIGLGGWWFSQPVIDSHGSMVYVRITYLIGGFPTFYMTFQKQLGMEWKNHPN